MAVLGVGLGALIKNQAGAIVLALVSFAAIWFIVRLRGEAAPSNAKDVYIPEDRSGDAATGDVVLVEVRKPRGSEPGPRGTPVDVLMLAVPCRALADSVTLQLSVLDHDDVRGQLKPDARGRPQVGDAAALRRLLADAATATPAP